MCQARKSPLAQPTASCMYMRSERDQTANAKATTRSRLSRRTMEIRTHSNGSIRETHQRETGARTWCKTESIEAIRWGQSAPAHPAEAARTNYPSVRSNKASKLERRERWFSKILPPQWRQQPKLLLQSFCSRKVVIFALAASTVRSDSLEASRSACRLSLDNTPILLNWQASGQPDNSHPLTKRAKARRYQAGNQITGT